MEAGEAAARWRRADFALAAVFVLDIVVVTAVMLAGGGFNPVFLSFYLPIIFMAGSCLPRRYTAIFPSAATLGLAYIALRQMNPAAVVSTLLSFSVLFFVVAYLAGLLGQGLFVERLRRRAERAETGLEKHRAISAMAAGLAHEIRNPLASLRGAMQEVGRSFPAGSENRQLCDVVIAESDRLDGVVGRFLDFARESRPVFARKRLSPLLADVKSMLARSPDGEGVRIELRVESDPAVACDAERLMEVFFNLALNACQLAERLDITLRAERKGVEILFEDNGPGFAGEDGDSLFAPFFTRRAGGTGMGLAVARKQTEAHGGTIDAENREEGGARFRVWLPLAQRQNESGRRPGGD